MGWIGVDLDGTLAHYDGWQGSLHIGEPIPLMLARVKRWLAEGKEVRIVTARVGPASIARDDEPVSEVVGAIIAWCEKHLGQALTVQCEKEYGMYELWDDRAVTVEKNTGRCLTYTPVYAAQDDK